MLESRDWTSKKDISFTNISEWFDCESKCKSSKKQLKPTCHQSSFRMFQFDRQILHPPVTQCPWFIFGGLILNGDWKRLTMKDRVAPFCLSHWGCLIKDGAANEVNNKWNTTPLGQEQEKNEAIKYLNQLIVVVRTIFFFFKIEPKAKNINEIWVLILLWMASL